MGAAIRSAKTFDSVALASFDYDFGKPSDSDLLQAKQEIFAAAQTGRLK